MLTSVKEVLFITSILQMGKLKHRVIELSKSCKLWGQDSDSGREFSNYHYARLLHVAIDISEGLRRKKWKYFQGFPTPMGTILESLMGRHYFYSKPQLLSQTLRINELP